MAVLVGIESISKGEADLLNELIKDSSQKDRDIATKLGVSPSTIGKWKKKLVAEGVIDKFSCLINYEALGLTTVVYCHVAAESQDDNAIFAFEEELGNIGEVVELYRCTGDFDYLVKIVVRSNPDFDDVRRRMASLKNFAHMKSEFMIKSVIKRNLDVEVNGGG